MIFLIYFYTDILFIPTLYFPILAIYLSIDLYIIILIFSQIVTFMNVLSQGTNAYDTYSLEKFSETFIVQN